MERLKFDYMKPQTALGYEFFAVPKMLFENPVFDDLELGAKMIYSGFLNRAALNAKKGDRYLDEHGLLYIIYPVEEIMQYFKCSKSTALKWLDQLDKIGLIERRRLGLGEPNHIYVKDFKTATSSDRPDTLTDQRSDEVPNSNDESIMEKGSSLCEVSRSLKNRLPEVQNTDHQKSKNWTSGSLNSGPQEVQKMDPNIDLKDLDLKTLDLDTPSIPPSNPPAEVKKEGRMEGSSSLEMLEAYVKDQIEFDVLLSQGYGKDQLMEVVRLITDTLCRAGPVKLNSGIVPEAAVKKRMRELEPEHIAFVLDKLADTPNIRNARAYMLTLLYNAPSSSVNAEIAGFNRTGI